LPENTSFAPQPPFFFHAGCGIDCTMKTAMEPLPLPTLISSPQTSCVPVIPKSACEKLDISPDAYGELRRTDAALLQDDPEELRVRMAEDGYLYIPGFFNRADVLNVRDNMLARLAHAGALDPLFPQADAVASAAPVHVSRSEILADPGSASAARTAGSVGIAHAQSFGPSPIPGLVFSPQLLDFYKLLLGGPIRHYDHIWLRLVRPGKGTLPHCDLPYMGRGTRNVYTAWIPYRDTSLKLGGLMLLEKSHLQAGRIRAYLESDVDVYCENRGPYKHKNGLLSTNPATLRKHLGGRWLTTEFRAGDLLTFGMSFVHASLDNQTNEYRMSTDTRYQLAAKPIDERWIGPATEEYAVKNRIGKVC
jgi:hypothetical protein